MCNQSKYSITIIVVLFLLMVAGCAYQSMQVTNLNENSYAPTKKESVEIYDVGNAPQNSYEVLGRVYVRKRGTPLNQGSPKGIREDVQSEAAKMGADAVIGFYTSKLDEHGILPYGCWGSGIAIKIENSDSSKGLKPPDCSVLMISPNGQELLPYCQVHLEKKGYYATPISQKYQSIDLSIIDSLAADSLLTDVIASEFAYVLFIDVLSKETGVSPEALVSTDYSRGTLNNRIQTVSNRMVAPLGSTKVSASLYSVATGDVVWHDTATGKESIFLSLQGQLKTGDTCMSSDNLDTSS